MQKKQYSITHEIQPKQYSVNPNVTAYDLRKHGFEDRLDYYHLRKQFDKFFQLIINIYIDETGKYMTNIVTCDGTIYAPYYNPDFRKKNLVCAELIQKVNNYMDGLVKQKILVHEKNKHNKNNKNNKQVKCTSYTNNIANNNNTNNNKSKRLKTVKLKDVKDIGELFNVIDHCSGRVELIGDGVKINLKSKLAQYFSWEGFLSNKEEFENLELVAYDPKDIQKLFNFINGINKNKLD